MTSLPEHPDPIFTLLDHVIDERMYDTMFIQHEGPYYDVMMAVKRDFRALDSGRVIRGHWFKRPPSKTDSYVIRSDMYSQEADLHDLDSRPDKFRHVIPLWRVRKPLLDQLNLTFQINAPGSGFLMPMILLTRHFRCLEVLGDKGVDEDRNYPIAFFSEVDAIAAQAMLLTDRD